MAGVGFDIRIDDEEVLASLNRVYEAVADPAPLFDDIGASMVVSTQENFIKETAPSGAKWQRHARSTQRRRGAGAPILRERNLLFQSITHEATPAYARWGSGMAYAAIHQRGGTITHYARSQKATFAKNRKGNYRFAKHSSRAKSRVTKNVTIGEHTVTIPARPYLGISDEDKAMIIQKSDAYVAKALEGGQ